MGRQNAHRMIDTVYARLHGSILDRRLRPGTKLREVSLGKLFGVSRTTIRAALQRLESDGLVTIEPNKGASVTLPSVGEITDLFAVRRIVENGIAAQLCRNHSASLIKGLRQHVKSEQKAVAAGDYRRAIALMGEFHLLLAEATGSSVLVDFLKGIISRTSLFVSAFDDTSHRGCRSDEHIVLIDHIEAGDIPGAIASIEEHLAEVAASITAKAQQNAGGYHPLQYLFSEPLAAGKR